MLKTNVIVAYWFARHWLPLLECLFCCFQKYKWNPIDPIKMKPRKVWPTVFTVSGILCNRTVLHYCKSLRVKKKTALYQHFLFSVDFDGYLIFSEHHIRTLPKCRSKVRSKALTLHWRPVFDVEIRVWKYCQRKSCL